MAQLVASHFPDAGVHVLLVQVCPLGQLMHAPPFPHRLIVLPGTHWLPEQQPVEQFAGPQVVVVSGLHTPPVHV